MSDMSKCPNCPKSLTCPKHPRMSQAKPTTYQLNPLQSLFLGAAMSKPLRQTAEAAKFPSMQSSTISQLPICHSSLCSMNKCVSTTPLHRRQTDHSITAAFCTNYKLSLETNRNANSLSVPYRHALQRSQGGLSLLDADPRAACPHASCAL